MEFQKYFRTNLFRSYLAFSFLGFKSNGATLSFHHPNEPSNRGEDFAYTYDIRVDNWNYHTFQRFSTRAHENNKPCPTCSFYDDFQTYYDYYGVTDYAEQWVMAASKNESTNFPRNRGDADFSQFTNGKIGVAEGVQKGTLFLNVWMEVVRHLNDAISNCEKKCGSDCNEDGVDSLDAAIALYVGSSVGSDIQSDHTGRMLFNMAARRAYNTRTAGAEADRTGGAAWVNLQVKKAFNKAQLAIERNNCEAAAHSKRRIVALMKVPLIQGLLRYAYIRDFEYPEDEADQEKADGEAAAFLAAALPHIHKCSPIDADVIYNQMHVGSDAAGVSFSMIKETLERHYTCMGISCPMVGGKYDHASGLYVLGAEPCTEGTLAGPDLDAAALSAAQGGSKGSNPGTAVGSVFAAVAGILLAFVAYRRYRSGSIVKRRTSMAPPTNNLAAVSEIA